MTSIRAAAARTPARRVRHIDLLRAVAILAVVTGHWLVIAVEYDRRGRLTGSSVLGELTWSHPLTWLFQVMPVFFLVGGFANAASRAAGRPGAGGDADWLLDRSARLVRPTTVLLVVTAAAAAGARLLGVDPGQVATAAWLVTVPLWFLVAYLAMVVLTPVTLRLHRRFGLAVPVALLALVLAGDVLRFATGGEQAGYGNFLFGWLAVHQVGFAWYDRRLPTRPAPAAAVFAGGLAALILLTTAGPYPVSMVTVPGQTVQNPSPPTLALLGLAAAQLGLALLVWGRSERWLRRPRVWTVVVAVNTVILTVFLWHMAAVVLATLGLDRLGALPTPPVGSAAWLWWQLPWLLLLAAVLAVVVLGLGRVEARAAPPTRAVTGRPTRPAPAARAAGWLTGAPARLLAATLLGYAGTLGGLLGIAVVGRGGYDGPFALPSGALAGYLAGAAMLRLVRAARRSAPATAG